MTELQIGLLALGALAVVGVLVFNKVQEMRARRDGDSRFGSSHDDVLLGAHSKPMVTSEADVHAAAREALNPVAPAVAERIEPTWGRPAGTVDPASFAPDHQPPYDAGESATSAPDVAADAASTMPAAGRAMPEVVPPVLDARIDFIAELHVEEPMLGSHVLLELEKFPRGRNLDVDGFNEVAMTWEALDRNVVYERVRVGIQISDRSGPLRADELEAFQQGVSAMALALDARTEWPGEQSPLTRAVELDAFCAGVDVTIGINVVASAAFADTKLRGLGEANGFVREDDGVFRRRDDEGGELLRLWQPAPEVLSLALDVPRVPREASALALMAQCAKRVAAGIDGKLVDDNGKPLNDASIAAIQTSLAGIYGRMDAAGMPAGGVLARRVFS